MSQEIFIPHVIPQEPGKMDEVLARADLGRTKFPQLVEHWSLLRERLLKSTPLELQLQKLIDFRAFLPDPGSDFVLDLQPKLPELDSIVDPVIKEVQRIFELVDIPYPQSESAQVLAVEGRTFNNLLLQELGLNNYQEGLYIATLPNRTVVLDADRINSHCEQKKQDLTEVIRNLLTYELYQGSLPQKEVWIAKGTDYDADPTQAKMKRNGLVTAPAKISPDNLVARYHLQLGLSYLLYIMTLSESETKRLNLIDLQKESIATAMMVRNLGLKEVLAAAYLPEGLDKLSAVMDQRYGEGALETLYDFMNLDLNPKAAKLIHSTPYAPFDYTVTFLNSKRS